MDENQKAAIAASIRKRKEEMTVAEYEIWQKEQRDERKKKVKEKRHNVEQCLPEILSDRPLAFNEIRKQLGAHTEHLAGLLQEYHNCQASLTNFEPVTYFDENGEECRERYSPNTRLFWHQPIPQKTPERELKVMQAFFQQDRPLMFKELRELVDINYGHLLAALKALQDQGQITKQGQHYHADLF